MALLRPESRELDVKIVYYGPALAGKTTNLLALNRILGPERAGKMISLNTQEDRTLFFDLLPVDMGRARGFQLRFRLYTVPGQVCYVATRHIVLAGADGVVLVLDSAPDRADANAASIQDLRDGMVKAGLDPADVPVIVQWNKRDLPGCSALEELAARLAPWSPPAIPAIATEGKGVTESFVAITELSLARLSARLCLPELPAVALALRCRLGRPAEQTGTPQAAPQAIRLPEDGAPMRDTQRLLHKAILGMVRSAEEGAAREGDGRRAARERDGLRELAAVANRLLAATTTSPLPDVVRQAMVIAGADGGALSLLSGGRLETRVLEGLAREPLAAVVQGAGTTLLDELVADKETFFSEDLAQDLSLPSLSDGEKVVQGVIFLRLSMGGRALGALTLYGSRPEAPLRSEALDVLRLLGSQLAHFLERDLLRRQVAASREAWVATVDALPDLLYVIDERHVFQRVNRAFAAAVGSTPRELVGRRCHDVLFGRDDPCATCHLAPALQGERGVKACELQGYLPGRSLESRAVPLPSSGNGRMVLATLHDVTARKAMARELMDSEKLASLGRLAAGMCHEVNNPLAFIQGNLDYLDQIVAHAPLSAGAREDVRSALRDAGTGVERVKKVVAQLRRCAPQDDGRRAPMDLWQIARTSAHIARDECSRAGVSLRLSGSSLPIHGHPGELGMVVRSLVRNAIEASPDRGVVDVSVAADDGRARIAVKDRGAGIPPEARSHLFEPFFTTKGPGIHMGLSLAMAYAVVTAMGGRIDVQSPAGGGTTFVVELPSVPVASATLARPGAHSHHHEAAVGE